MMDERERYVDAALGAGSIATSALMLIAADEPILTTFIKENVPDCLEKLVEPEFDFAKSSASAVLEGSAREAFTTMALMAISHAIFLQELAKIVFVHPKLSAYQLYYLYYWEKENGQETSPQD